MCVVYEMSTVTAIAPYIQTSHGFVVFLESENEGPQVAPNGNGIIYMSGMIHGSPFSMCNQVDYVFARVEACSIKRVIAVIDASQVSFRFPDVNMRHVFKHLRKYEHLLGEIYFWKLPMLLRSGIRLFAFPLLSTNLRERIFLCKPTELSIDFDAGKYLEWRMRVEHVSITEASSFDTNDLSISRAALSAHMKKEDLIAQAGELLYTTTMEKQGRGGLFGNTRWKRKHIGVTASHLVYYDNASIELIERATIREIKCVDPRVVHVTVTSPPYVFRAESVSVASEFVTALSTDTRFAVTTAS